MARALRKSKVKVTTSTTATAPPANLPPKMDAAATLAPAIVIVVAISTQPVMLPLHFHAMVAIKKGEGT